MKSIIGKKVKIYEDPVSKTKIEGEAIILQLLNDNGRFLECQIQFENGDILHRLIFKEDLEK